MKNAAEKYRKYGYYLPRFIILTGCVARIILWLQNRNLFIDEANVARNIYERGFGALVLPLSYEQYAPPVFLWFVKLCAVIGGYSEMALRFFPLLAGMAALVVMYLLLKQLMRQRALWYPLAMMAAGYLFLRYSTELKQYITDVLVCLSLLLLAVKTRNEDRRFLYKWLAAGTVAIWSSMPSVFVLAGIGAYYAYDALAQKNTRQLLRLVIVCCWWLGQFLLYYYFILRHQITSGYLQHYHNEYFLHLYPYNRAHWHDGWSLLSILFKETCGYDSYTYVFNSIAFVTGITALLWKDRKLAALLLAPIAATLAAAALQQFSLIPRVTLFMLPLFLVVIGKGLDTLLSLRRWWWQAAVIMYACINVKHHSMLGSVSKPWENEEITTGMQYISGRHISGDALYVENGAMPAFMYYTRIHPAKKRWQALSGAHFMPYDVNYDSLGAAMPARSAILFTSGDPAQFREKMPQVMSHMAYTDSLALPRGYVYIFGKR